MSRSQPKPPAREARTFAVRLECRKKGDDSPPRMTGHAAVFDQEADIAGLFREVVAPGAFKSSIKDDDIRALFNHDENFVLGRNTAGTLSLKEDDTGLAVEITPPDTQAARDLMTSMERGDITQMSFGFSVTEEEWKEEEGKTDLRTLKAVRLYDVSPVTFPAYEGTDIAVRSRDAWQRNQTMPRAKRAAHELTLRRKS